MYLQPDIEDLMAAELEDLRTKVPTDCLSVLRAISLATGDDISTIARQALVEFTKKQLHLAIMISRVTRGEVDDGADKGKGRA